MGAAKNAAAAGHAVDAGPWLKLRGYDFGLLVERQGLYHFDDLPSGYSPRNGYWHRHYCWFDGYWYLGGRGMPYSWDYRDEDPWYW